ncbi:hypothetical protein [Flammeovirga sp. EKP202]|uniref:hypothetical protein n=1 Tax=Flammeovirga sp. EKP202 TaxID=2770592 RepID=UPI00165FCEDD|nr:hypothetical protein [Flammeovirga sp. EKP202]MBD0401165.1 hypothetical protein [Flammeovirga sp. EKP202]
MKWILLFSLMVISYHKVESQNIDFNKKVTVDDRLSGNYILQNTRNQKIAWGCGIYLDSVTIHSCKEPQTVVVLVGDDNTESNKSDHSEEDYYIEKVTNFNFSEESFQVDIDKISNCCQYFLIDYTIINEQTLDLISQSYGIDCSCDCKFKMSFYFKISDAEKMNKLKNITINGDGNYKIMI